MYLGVERVHHLLMDHLNAKVHGKVVWEETVDPTLKCRIPTKDIVQLRVLAPHFSNPLCLDDGGNGFDLNERILGELSDLDRRARGGLGREVLGVDFVHALEVLDVLYTGSFHDMIRDRWTIRFCEV